MVGRDGGNCIGILCDAEQPVFTVVAEGLRDVGYTVRFFDPRAELSATQIDDLSLLVNKQVFPPVFPTLKYARRTEIPLWNNLPATIAFSSRLVWLNALEEVGILVPPVAFEKPEGEYVAKDTYIWNGEPKLTARGISIKT